MKCRIYKILKHTSVEGPKKRYCIWFQGCSRHCKGCWAKATWSFDGGYEADTNDILADILNTKDIDGVTFLGGEPFEQPRALLELARNIQKAGLSVVCFSGFKIDELRKKHNEILKYLDILIDGEFDESKKDFSRPWVGSSNQNYHFLSNRFDESIITKYKNRIEVNIQEDGLIFINGMGDFEKLEKKINMFSYH